MKTIEKNLMNTWTYPYSKVGQTYLQYKFEVDCEVKKGFNLIDLDVEDYEFYLRGSGSYKEVDINGIIDYD